MRSKPGQTQEVGVGFSVNQQQIWFDVALTITCPIAAQVMIAEPRLQGLIVGQSRQNRHKVCIK